MIFKKSPTNHIEEKELVKKILQGEREALYWFWKKFQTKIMAYINSKINDPKDAEEVFQNTLMAGLDNLRDFNFNSCLYTFLYSIARHKIIDYYRKKKIAQIVFSHLPGLKKVCTEILSPEEKLINQELKQKIRQVLIKLAPIEAKVIQLKYENSLSVKEIARELSISVKSAESRLYRARLAFIKVFNEREQVLAKVNPQTRRDYRSFS